MVAKVFLLSVGQQDNIEYWKISKITLYLNSVEYFLNKKNNKSFVNC
jgi:hypothetical protein